MPFTLAHPSIVLPLSRLPYRLSLTAMVAGSMVPDFEFFLQMREVENIGHKWYGIFLFDFPLALLFCFLFHNLLKFPLITNLPDFYRSRFMPVLGFNWNKFVRTNPLSVVVSLAAGILSHIFWDGFTHADGLFVQLIPMLQRSAGFQNAAMPVYFLLQILFSIIGLWSILHTVHALPKVTDAPAFSYNRFYWPIYSVLFTGILLIRLVYWPQYNTFWGVFMAVMGGICYAWLLVSFIIQYRLIKNSAK